MLKKIKLFFKKHKKYSHYFLTFFIIFIFLIIYIFLNNSKNINLKSADINNKKTINNNITFSDNISHLIDVNNKDYSWKNKNIEIILKSINNTSIIYSKYRINDKNWCHNNWKLYKNNQKIILKKEWENYIYLCTKDNLWNTNDYIYWPYKIDKTLPSIILEYPKNKLAWNNNFYLKYRLFDNINWVENQINYNKYDLNYSYSIIWDNPQISTWKNKVNSEKIDYYSLTNASEYDEEFKIVFTITDKAGNSVTKKGNFKIYPNIIKNQKNKNNSIISLKNEFWEKFANNSDYYEYDIQLKDEFWNNIYNKKLNYIKQDIIWFNVWNTIKTYNILLLIKCFKNRT